MTRSIVSHRKEKEMDNNEITIQLLRGILETETEILKAIKMSDLLSTREAAEMLHTSGTRIDELRRSGILHGAKIGKGYIFDRNEVVNYVKERIEQ